MHQDSRCKMQEAKCQATVATATSSILHLSRPSTCVANTGRVNLSWGNSGRERQGQTSNMWPESLRLRPRTVGGGGGGVQLAQQGTGTLGTVEASWGKC